jgi:hypothetical protein
MISKYLVVRTLVVWQCGAVLALAGAGYALAAQKDVATEKGADLVTIAGCVHGSHFKPSRDSLNDLPASVVGASEWTLRGKRELLQRLQRDHDGHLEEVTGVIKIPQGPDQTTAQVRSKDLGKKTRVTIGERQSNGWIKETPQPITITVDSFRHMEMRCTPK